MHELSHSRIANPANARKSKRPAAAGRRCTLVQNYEACFSTRGSVTLRSSTMVRVTSNSLNFFWSGK